MRKRLFLIMLAVLLLSGTYALVPGEAQEQDTPAINIDMAFNDMVENFGIYLSFFHNTYPAGSFYVPRHGETPEEALSYLTQAFEPELAQAILDTYTFYNNELGKLQIIPTDGLPVISWENENETSYTIISENNILFEYPIINPYGENQTYLYQVLLKFQENKWIVYDLELAPICNL